MNLSKLIIISDLPGSGKSSLAKAISKQLKLPIFSVDPIESSIIKSGIAKSFETGLAAYLVVEMMALEQLELDISVIIDAVSAEKESREMWCGLSKKFNAELIIIECVLNRETHQSRIYQINYLLIAIGEEFLRKNCDRECKLYQAIQRHSPSKFLPKRRS